MLRLPAWCFFLCVWGGDCSPFFFRGVYHLFFQVSDTPLHGLVPFLPSFSFLFVFECYFKVPGSVRHTPACNLSGTGLFLVPPTGRLQQHGAGRLWQDLC